MHSDSLWIETKYVSLISSRLDKFKKVGDNTYNFRCPICGDSEKNKTKRRGYIFQDKGKLFFKCHNCGASHNFPNFLKTIDVNMFNEFMFERFKETGSKIPERRFKTDISKHTNETHRRFQPLAKLKKISQLPHDHPAKTYVMERKLPPWSHSILYHVPKFNKWINSIIPDKISKESKDEARLVIPFIDRNGYVFGVQGRSYKKNSNLRYITILFKDRKKVYGLDRLKTDDDFFIVEGPLDSLFLENSIAMAGADLDDKYTTNRHAIHAYDNEPWNKEILERMGSVIDNGYRIVIWPSSIKEKDVNDMVLSGIGSKELSALMKENTYSGLMARMKFNEWKKLKHG